MKETFLGIIGSVIILPVYSQHYIKGIIIDSENAVMPMVNVAFLNQADSTSLPGQFQTLVGCTARRSIREAILFAILIWVMKHYIRTYKSMRMSHFR